MADDLSKTISKHNAGFPEYLDFPKLRSAAIEYLGKLSGKIWTDHNVHDPGITIMEMLIYAIMDLGYRTNLPVADLFARDPAEKGPDNNFFTASQILGNNPLTITDLRKLLVDIKGVKNAWLEIDSSIPVDFCKEESTPVYDHEFVLYNGDNDDDFCGCQSLNGLYHVYVQLEKDIDQNKHKYQEVIRKIRKELMAHRNLCEDYLEINVLCQLNIGICAEIELETDADEEEVFLEILEGLQEYFSPAPHFYTFQQLIEKGRTVEEIFAGRPFNLSESHGFVDTEEFEQLALRKVLNLSDLYQVIFSVKGVLGVRNLGWIKCCDDKHTPGKADRNWQLELPENHIPEFTLQCSGFHFTKNGISLNVDVNSVKDRFDLNRSVSYKSVYQIDSPYLGPEFPKGNYRPELTNYMSIQSEFPRVYGISEGGLDSRSATDRIARARQLQGFLIFFDQLLANYLTQLKNIRSLFSFSSPKQGGHTYFINRLTNVPHFQELIRFRTEEGVIGNEGNILAYPTERKKLEHFIESGKIKFSGPKRKCKDGYRDDFPVYGFCHAAERDQAVRQLQEDLKYEEISPVIVSNETECYFFYFFTSSSSFAMISKIYYKDEQDARNAAASVKYAALFEENYRNYILASPSSGNEMFSFDVELNLNTYDNYLQLIAEDPSLYGKRRQGFLDHLLSRFAEKFTDYALLSAPFLSEEKLLPSSIAARERFLAHYADISSNRGKAYDYMLDGWGNNNISGFEKRFKALTGIEQWERRYLCNFIVDKADEQYQLMITLFNEVFELQEKFPDKSTALASLKSLYAILSQGPCFQPKQSALTGQWHIVIQDALGYDYTSRRTFEDERHAQQFAEQLHSSLVFKPGEQNVFPVSYVHKILLKNMEGKEIVESREEFRSHENAAAYINRISKNLSAHARNEKEFGSRVGKNLPEKLLSFSDRGGQQYFVNEAEFVFKHLDVFQLAEQKKKFTLLNKEATVQFDSLMIYDGIKQAKDGFRSLLGLLHNPDHYLVEEDRDEFVHRIYIISDNEKKAVYFQNFERPEDAWARARALAAQMSQHVYQLHISDPQPDIWEFSFEPSVPGHQKLHFQSRAQYKSSPLAQRAAENFYSNIGNMELKAQGDELTLQKPGTKMQVFAGIATEEEQKTAQKIWSSYQSTFNTMAASSHAELQQLLPQYRINADEQFIYKLVDRNTVWARYFGTGALTSQKEAEDKKNELIGLAASGYDFVNIAIGGEPVRERKDADGKVKWYHYQIKCTNRFYTKGELSGQPLVLFESVKGYTAREEAVKAFLENYGDILRWGRLQLNYGSNKPISLEENFIHADNPCLQDRTVVFVPRETSLEFNGYEVQKELVLLIRNYPLRFIRKNKIRFSLSRIAGASVMEDWRSTKSYTNVKDALQAFHFFLMLLKYPGNFFVDYDETKCSYQISIREVLAVSAHGFSTAEAAWGEQGIERFICIGQTTDGFHNYWNGLNCSYSFYLACGNTGLIHPCSYETPARRDAILERLWKAGSFNFFDLVVDITEESIMLLDANKNHLAWIHMDPEVGNFSVCEWLVIFMETLHYDENYEKSDKGPLLKYKYKKEKDLHYRYHTIAESSAKDIPGLKEWKKRLLQIVCYFPVVKISSSGGSHDKYYIDIKLPGFESCESYSGCDPCLPEINDDPCRISCYTSWKSECCFNTACEALEFYAYAHGLLRNRENYKAVFDCNCGSYRIELHPRLSTEGRKTLISHSIELLRVIRRYTQVRLSYNPGLYNSLNYRDKKSCLSEIIAINPQQYENEKMVCEAAERARKLINGEGLHLAEHILFRPRCKEKDLQHYTECSCEFQPRPYAHPEINCHFTWKPGGDVDPCEEDKTVCFTPGCDPYSFIATVVLPAWPERFRNNKELIEKILRREAPAHVMLRILWLRPRDLCCFEQYFKPWNEWLAKKLCDPTYSSCEFMGFLFRKYFSELPDCQDCKPCSETTQNNNCFKEEKQDECDHNVNHIIDELFHWGKGLPGFDYTGYGPCMQDVREKEEIMDVGGLLRIREPVPPEEIEVLPVHEILRPEKEKSAVIQRRTKFYRQNINSIAPGNPFSDDAIIFLQNTRPDPKRYRKLVENIIGDKIGKGKKLRGRVSGDKKILITNITWKYLDLVCFHKNQEKNIEAIEDVFAFLARKGIDMKSIYEEWDSTTIKEIEPSAGIDMIRYSLTRE